MDKRIPHILIVDDDPNMIGTVSDILIAKGFEPLSALTGTDALTRVMEHHFEVALIDLRLGDMSGMDVLRDIKARSPRTECILLTGYATQSSAIDAIQVGAFGYFQKPFDMEQVLLSIQRAVEKHTAEEALHKSEQRYRGLFEDSPIAIWDEDFSEVKAYLDSLKQQGVMDFQDYFLLHPQAINECLAKIKIVDVNNSAVRMFKAGSKEELLKITDQAPSKGELEHIHEDLIAIAEGRTSNSWEGPDETLSGEPIEISLNWSVVPGYEDDFSKVIVTTLNITERKRAEEALRKNEALLSEAQRIGKIGHWEWSAPGDELTCSDELLNILEIPRDGRKISQKIIGQLMHPEDMVRVKMLDREIFSKNLDIDYEYRIILPGDRLRWIYQQAKVFYGANGQPLRMIGVMQDITERKAVDEAFHKSDAQYRLLANHISDVIWILDLETGRYTYISPSVEQLRGFTPSEIFTQDLSASLTPDSFDSIQKFIPKRLAEAQQGIQISYTDEVAQPCKDGTTVWTETNTHYNLNKVSGHWEVYGVSRNITERRKAQEALRENEERYRLLFENAPVGIFSADPQGRIIEINPAALQILGSPSLEATRAINLLTFPLLVKTGFSVNFQQCVESGQPVFAEQSYTSAWGKSVFAQYRLTPISDGSGQISIVQVIIEEVTERKLAEDALRESEKRYHDLFEDSPIALREEDFSEVKKYLDLLRLQGVTDFQKYFTLHPETIYECAAKIKIVDVNKAAIKMYRADSKNDMPIKFIDILNRKATEHFKSQLANIAEGQVNFNWEGTDQTIDGREINVEVNWSVAAGYEKDLSKVIVSLQDITERKQAEESLLASEERYRQLFENSPIGIYRTTPDGRILVCSPALVRMLGFSSFEELSMRNLEQGDADPAYSRSMFKEQIEREGRINGLEAIWTKRDGSPIIVREYARAIRDESGAILYYEGTVEDITERSHAEKLVAEQSEQIKLLYEASQQLNRTLDLKDIYQAVCDFMSTIAVNDGLFISAFNPETRLITCRAFWMENKWLDVNSFPPIQFEEGGRDTQSLVIRTGRPMLINDYQELVKNTQDGSPPFNKRSKAVDVPVEEDITRSALVVPLKTGGRINGVIQVMSYRLNAYNENQLKLLEALALHIASAEQNALLYSQVQTELNERKLVEKSLREREEQYRTLVEQLPAIVYIDDANLEGRTLYISPQIEAILGFSPQEWQEKSPGLWSQQVYPDDLERVHVEYVRCFLQGESFDMEYRIYSSDHRLLWLRDQAIMLPDENGKPHLIHGVIYDITERKQAEANILRLNRLYATFSEINQTIVHVSDQQTLFEEICRVTVEYGQFRMAWIGLIQGAGHPIKPAAFAGEELGYLKNVRITYDEENFGRGPTGTAIREGHCVICQDIATNPLMAPWQDQALSRGYRSSASLPIFLQDRVIGALTVYANEPDGFDAEDEKLLNEIGKNISFALNTIQVEAQRRQGEEFLRISEERYRGLFNSMIEGFALHEIICDENGKPVDYRFLEANPAFERLTGLQSENLIGKTMTEVLPNNESYWVDVFGNVALTGRSTFYENYARELGRYFEVSVYCPRPGQFAVIMVDITERKQAEEALRAASSYNRRLIEASLDPLVTIGPDGKITDVNGATEAVTGVLRERIIGDDFSNYFTEPEKARDGYQKMLAEGLVRDYPLTIRHASGKTTDVLYNATVYKNEAGEIQGVFAAARDITERKYAEEVLRTSEARLNEAQRIAHIGSWQLDIVNNTLTWSDEIYRMFEIDPKKFGASYDAFLDAIHPDDREAVNFAYTNSLDTRTPYNIEHRLRFADGRIKYVHEQCETLYDAESKPLRSFGTVQNITERKQAEEGIHQRVLELELLYESGLAFSQLLNPKEIAQKIINLLDKKMDWHHTAIRLYDTETKTLQLLAYNQPGLSSAEDTVAAEELLKAKVTRLDQGVSGWVIQHGQTIRSSDLANNEHYVETVPGMQSGLYVPIKLGESVIGVISIESEQPNAFNEADERLTNTLANQAASALENARLFDETRLHIMELTALHRTGQTLLAARLNAEQIYAAVHQAVAQTMPCDAFVIVLDDEDHGEYHAVYVFDGGQRYPARRLPRDKGMSGRVISSGKTALINELNEVDLQATHFGSSNSARSILAVPLRRGSEIIGMLSTQSYRPHAFGGPQQVLLETITAQLSSALDNANLYRQTQERIKELEILHVISASLRTIQSVDGVLSTILDKTLATLETDAGSILLYDSPSNTLHDIVTRGWFMEIASIPVKADEGVAGMVFTSGKLYSSIEFIRDTLPHTSARGRIPAGWGGVCLPIRTSTEVVGVMFVSVQLPRQLDSQQIKLIESLVEIAGAALQRIRLFDETARRAEEFSSLYETSKVLSAEYELDSLLEVIVNGAKTMLNAATSGMYLYDAERQDLVLTKDTSLAIPIGTRLPIGDGGAGKVAQTRQPLRIDDYSTWEGRASQYGHLSIRAIIEVPMLYAGELIGVLTAEEIRDSSRKFTEADERLLSLFASQAAGAINSARQRAATIRHAEELEQRVVERTMEIEATRKRLDLAAKAGGIGVWEVDLMENKVFWDKRMHFIQGTDDTIEFDDSLETWWKEIHPEDLEQTKNHFTDALQKTGVFSDEHRIIRPDGALRYVSLNGIVLSDAEYKPERMIGVAVDITDRKQAEEALHRANFEMERALRTKDEFLANMSHELRTPLNAILGISESLEEQFVGALNEKQLKYTGIIRESGRHLLELINDILDISKIEAGRMELDMHSLSVEKICQSSLRMVKELAQKKSLNVSFEMKGNVKTILGDERRLKQSLVNLLGNAVKFTPQGGSIGLEVNGHADVSEVTFTVWDSGVGIADEDIQYLFKPFVQLDAGLAREYQGTGLGLALVAQMIRLHGGNVHVESVLGKGSRFIITLPWMDEQQNAPAKGATGELPHLSLKSGRKRTGKILLVEDTNVVITLMSEYLIYKGYKVLIARNGLEGVQLAKEEHPDLILMDVMMPVMDGLEATRQIRADLSLQNVPIIALTALAMAGDREYCMAAGMNDYMSKPIKMQELSDMIEKYLGNGEQPAHAK